MIKVLWYEIKVIIFPVYWISNASVNRRLDKLVKRLIKNKEEITNFGSHTTTIKGFTFWTRNYPYAYGSLNAGSISGLPRRTTRILLKEYIEKAYFEKLEKGDN